MNTQIARLLERFKTAAAPFYGQIVEARNSCPDCFDEAASCIIALAELQIGEGYIDRLVDGYCRFVVDVNRSQMDYEKSGKYRYSSYGDVYERTYNNSEFMHLYHWGVLVTIFAWAHHLAIFKFFQDDFVSLINRDKKPTLVDIGCGSGIWHFLAHRKCPSMASLGIDISETSIDICRKTAARLSPQPIAEYVAMDALKFKAQKSYDFGISCFLLEHLEDPGTLLKVLSDSLKPRAYAWVTCALTAAEVDHIYEITHEHQAMKMAYDAGFRVIKSFSASPLSYPEDSYYLPRSFAMLLQKRRNPIW